MPEPGTARRPVRVGFLGAGFIASYHAWQLGRSTTPHAITAVYDPDQRRSADFAAAESAHDAQSMDEVLDLCDAVFVCTWTSEHPAIVKAAAERGRAIFCEKPLAPDLDTAQQMGRWVADSGVVNMVGLVLRSVPGFVALRKLLVDLDVGRVMSVAFRDDQFLPIDAHHESGARTNISRAGSGTILEHSIHDLDILEWLCGPAVSVSAHSEFFHAIDGIEDSVVVVLRFAGGQLASLTSVWHDVLARPSQRRVEVFCERSLLTLDGESAGPLRWQGVGGEGSMEGDEIVAWLAERQSAPGHAEEAFLRAAAGGVPAVGPSFDDALRAHVLADAVYRSAAAGGVPIDVSPRQV